MAFKLKKTEVTELLELAGKLRAAEDAVEEAVIDYNLKLTDAKAWVEKVAETWRGEFDDKSEEWQGSERGDEVNQLIESFEGFLQEFDEVEVDASGSADALEALDHEVV